MGACAWSCKECSPNNQLGPREASLWFPIQHHAHAHKFIRVHSMSRIACKAHLYLHRDAIRGLGFLSH